MKLLRSENRVLAAAVGTIVATVMAALVVSTMYVDSSTLPPVGAFYQANDLGWVSFVRALSALIVGSCMYALMWSSAADVPHHRNEALRMRYIAKTILFAVAGSWAFTNFGMVVWGGFWHIVGLGFSILTSISAIHTCVVYSKTRYDVLAIEE